MHTLERRTRAVEPCIKHGLKAATTIGELGHPSRVRLAAWHREWLETGGSLHARGRASEAYSAEQRRAAVDHCLEHGRCDAHARRELGYPKSYQRLADWIEELAPGERRTTEPGTFTLGQRQRAVTALVGRAGSAREIADEAGSSRRAPRKWKGELLGEGPDMTEAKHGAPAQGAGDGGGREGRPGDAGRHRRPRGEEEGAGGGAPPARARARRDGGRLGAVLLHLEVDHPVTDI